MADNHARVDLFWSVRSPYCYLALHRLRLLAQELPLELVLRPVYPMGLRRPGQHGPPGSAKASYNFIDAARVAKMLGLPFHSPLPDPLDARPDGETHAHVLTRLLVVADSFGKSLELADKFAVAIFAKEDDWSKEDALSDCIKNVGLDAAHLVAELSEHPDPIARRLQENTEALEAAGHWGVPVMVWNNEPFYGQDRVAVLAWRLRQQLL
ncbi:DSBA-like thioredoxin domain protein [Marinovum algicola]|uniref:2-hydroxychromene-2-carboxylate isomerase n=1 Tax=Marinovum algicola TaxID=42444 RepID=A0A975WFE7_9RHOB|nr:DsbA family protein [Marinovum algicola]SEK11126.1 2-hydroxychromene-2-carboxylate isomerase [Marinovum algicola]SLN71178.1 DSBA-like thioredoxin domain protein [Marinovum algicola]